MKPETRQYKRKLLGYSQWEVSLLLACSVTQVSAMETGRGRVSPDLIKQYEYLLLKKGDKQ